MNRYRYLGLGHALFAAQRELDAAVEKVVGLRVLLAQEKARALTLPFDWRAVAQMMIGPVLYVLPALAKRKR